jgi:hypothetical protein
MAAKKRLTDSDVRWLRKMYARHSLRCLAKIVGCSAQHASDIIKRKRRASVADYS